VLFDQVAFVEGDDRSSTCIQVCEVQAVCIAFGIIRQLYVDVLASFRQDNLQCEVFDGLIVHDVVNKTHLQHIQITSGVEIVVAWQVVPEVVEGFPASKEWETWSQFEIN